ncbi:hypothetical protein HNY73_020804 [Argiope bruennichi]|uniref:Uncharacterized protein n=1 Tax=Argiope bruennichi TaxID=94029 RepID=A0A8T0EBW5_ARGBR|nr:hypothetical protein HNY73_020804 [Argiope bruennichi]
MTESDNSEPPLEQKNNQVERVITKSQTWPRPKRNKEELQAMSLVLEPCCSCNKCHSYFIDEVDYKGSHVPSVIKTAMSIIFG